MNLYLRLIRAIVKAYFKPSIAVGDKIETSFRVWPGDLDINGHMNNGRYLTIVDLMLVEYFIRCGFFRTLMKRGWRPMLGGSTINFRRGLKLFETYTVRFELVCWDDRWNYMSFEFIHDGRVAAGGLSKGAVVGKNGFVGNATAYQAMGIGRASPPEPARVASWRDADSRLMDTTVA